LLGLRILTLSGGAETLLLYFWEVSFEGLEEVFWGKTSVEVFGGCGRCKRNLEKDKFFFPPQFLKRL